MDIAKIATMPVDLKRKVTQDDKAKFIKIVEEEFQSQATKFDSEVVAAKAKFLEDYRKQVGFAKLKREYDLLQLKISAVTAKINDLGLDNRGDLNYSVAGTELRQKQDEIARRILPARNLKNKIVARLVMAGTHGEILVILQEVLGNGVLPKVSAVQARALVPQIDSTVTQ